MKKKSLLPLALLAGGLAAMTLASCSAFSQDGDQIEVIGEVNKASQARYTVTFNPCNGDSPSRVRGKSGEKPSFPTKNPSKSGMGFVGWASEYDSAKKMGKAEKVVDTSSYTFGSSNVVLYAVYAKGEAHSEAAINDYMDAWKQQSEDGHLYYHYYRYDNSAASYNNWDVWAWSFAPTASEGHKFDWVGRSQDTTNKHNATGDAEIDDFGYAHIDIDMNASYWAGWDSKNKVFTDLSLNFSELGTKTIGLQIVQSATRFGGEGFWVNDGSNLFVDLDDYAMDLGEGKTAYHVFVVQENVQNPSARPAASSEDPFEDDDGTNVTYGKSTYSDVNFSSTAAKVKTAKDFTSIGTGYQIMVSSFADSDGDGFGDIYGIEQKLPYLKKLGVKALWLTPIQLSDSYHGYDITDYEQVDPKYGSTESPAGKANGGVVTKATALADYKSLIEAAHGEGMKIVMDLVLNHTSTSNKWFVSSANLDPEYRGFYQWGNHETQKADINQKKFWYPYGDHPYSYYAKFGSAMPELNYSYKSTREAVEEMSTYWVKDVGVDGFRLDAVKHIYMLDEVASSNSDSVIYDIDDKTNTSYSSNLTKNLNFFRELKSEVTKRSGRDVFFVGENFDGHAYHVAPYYEAFDSMFDFYAYYNLTSGARTGKEGTTSKFGTVVGWMEGSSPYTVAADNSTTKGAKDGGGILVQANGSPWNFPAVYNTYNKYRGDVSLPGAFTSNHDIARVINRIAGTGTAEGIQEQGNITASNYSEYEKSANLVKIAELMLPGLTWIYYGDEIGMTGNFPAGKTSTSDYADLWYRQPMKWVQGGSKGDGNGTTDYYVTGSGAKVEQDEINKSTAVKGALAQADDPNSDFSALAKFVKVKNENQALITGAMETAKFVDGGMLHANILQFKRTLNGTTIKVVVNFNNAPVQTIISGGLSGTVLASYGGATQSSMPAFSAIVVKQ